MSESYNEYKKARNTAWQILIDNRVNTLPINVVDIANNNNIAILKNSFAHELKEGEIGVSIFCNNNWFIIYDDTLVNKGRKRFTIAHELGHIFLGHSVRLSETSEKEADIFASRLLAPSCVLWGLNLHTAQDIANVCKISRQAAEIRADRMAILYERNKFLLNPLEQKVYRQFTNYINCHTLR